MGDTCQQLPAPHESSQHPKPPHLHADPPSRPSEHRAVLGLPGPSRGSLALCAACRAGGAPCPPPPPAPHTATPSCWLLPCSRISGLASAEIGSCLGEAFHFRMHSTRSSAHDIVINIWKDLLFLYKQQQHIAEAQLLAAELPGSLPQPCQGQEPQPPPMFLTSPHAEGLPGMPDVTLIHPRLWRLLVPPSRRPASYKKASLKPPKVRPEHGTRAQLPSPLQPRLSTARGSSLWPPFYTGHHSLSSPLRLHPSRSCISLHPGCSQLSTADPARSITETPAHSSPS